MKKEGQRVIVVCSGRLNGFLGRVVGRNGGLLLVVLDRDPFGEPVSFFEWEVALA